MWQKSTLGGRTLDKRLSFADLIALSGIVAMEYSMSFQPGCEDESCVPQVNFRVGRVDCPNRSSPPNRKEFFFPGPHHNNAPKLGAEFDLSPEEFTAILGAHTVGKMTKKNAAFEGQWTRKQHIFDNEYYRNLINASMGWKQQPNGGGHMFWQSNVKPVILLGVDMALAHKTEVPERVKGNSSCNVLKPLNNIPKCGPSDTADIVRRFARDNDEFLKQFGKAIGKVIENTKGVELYSVGATPPKNRNVIPDRNEKGKISTIKLESKKSKSEIEKEKPVVKEERKEKSQKKRNQEKKEERERKKEEAKQKKKADKKKQKKARRQQNRRDRSLARRRTTVTRPLVQSPFVDPNMIPHGVRLISRQKRQIGGLSGTLSRSVGAISRVREKMELLQRLQERLRSLMRNRQEQNEYESTTITSSAKTEAYSPTSSTTTEAYESTAKTTTEATTTKGYTTVTDNTEVESTSNAYSTTSETTTQSYTTKDGDGKATDAYETTTEDYAAPTTTTEDYGTTTEEPTTTNDITYTPTVSEYQTTTDQDNVEITYTPTASSSSPTSSISAGISSSTSTSTTSSPLLPLLGNDHQSGTVLHGRKKRSINDESEHYPRMKRQIGTDSQIDQIRQKINALLRNQKPAPTYAEKAGIKKKITTYAPKPINKKHKITYPKTTKRYKTTAEDITYTPETSSSTPSTTTVGYTSTSSSSSTTSPISSSTSSSSSTTSPISSSTSSTSSTTAVGPVVASEISYTPPSSSSTSSTTPSVAIHCLDCIDSGTVLVARTKRSVSANGHSVFKRQIGSSVNDLRDRIQSILKRIAGSDIATKAPIKKSVHKRRRPTIKQRPITEAEITYTPSTSTTTEAYETTTDSYETTTDSYETTTDSYETTAEPYETTTESYESSTTTEAYDTSPSSVSSTGSYDSSSTTSAAYGSSSTSTSTSTTSAPEPVCIGCIAHGRSLISRTKRSVDPDVMEHRIQKRQTGDLKTRLEKRLFSLREILKSRNIVPSKRTAQRKTKKQPTKRRKTTEQEITYTPSTSSTTTESYESSSTTESYGSTPSSSSSTTSAPTSTSSSSSTTSPISSSTSSTTTAVGPHVASEITYTPSSSSTSSTTIVPAAINCPGCIEHGAVLIDRP